MAPSRGDGCGELERAGGRRGDAEAAEDRQALGAEGGAAGGRPGPLLDPGGEAEEEAHLEGGARAVA